VVSGASAWAEAAQVAPSELKQMPDLSNAVGKVPFGMVDGKEVALYTLTNAHGLVARVMTYGAILTELHVPDRAGHSADIVLGFDDVAGYVACSPYFGATVGRVANRIKNARFELEGKAYALDANDGPHSLHGGLKGFDKVVWDARSSDGPSGPSVELTYVSPDGEEGFPGAVTVVTTYTLTHANELKVEMRATTDQTTIVNLVHHTYWNLGGHASGAVLGHQLQLHADDITPSDATLVPTGEVAPVAGTPFDFRSPKPIGRDLKAVGGKPVGYDHNFVVKGDPHTLRPVARVNDAESGRVMSLESDQPGVQFYSGNFLDGSVKGKGGAIYNQYGALCLESQRFPNSINVPAWKNEVVLRPGQTYGHTMIHRFTTE